MKTAAIIIFALELALLFVHEMDAIRREEWKMFIVLKNMADEKAYHIFMLLHVPLYMALLLLLFSPFFAMGYYVVDVFLAAHMLVHLGFSKHHANKLNSTISKAIINLSGLLALIHLFIISELLFKL